jgi:hypothetical protein
MSGTKSDFDIDSLVTTEATPSNDLSAAVAPTEEELRDERPAMTDDRWFSFVMKHFTDDELENGNPKAEGLRRVAELLLGPILESYPTPLQWPCPANEWAATVKFTIVFHWLYPEAGMPPHERTFAEVADVTEKNTPAEFALHPSASASTKAEGRALRKALKLKHVVAAEEVAPDGEEDNVDDSGTTMITSQQISFITSLCKRNKINLTKYINLGKAKYSNIADIEKATAVKMIKFLSDCQRDQTKIPKEVREIDDES